MSNSDSYKKIQKHLQEIEKQEKIHILWAGEVGSRASNFASSKSDFDVRFIYLRPINWYLSIYLGKKRDVLEYSFPLLEINGWDLQKTLKLYDNSNPSVYDLLRSPIIYQKKSSIPERLKESIESYYSLKTFFHQYFNHAQGNFNKYLKGELIRPKRYLYVLKGILAIRWLEQKQGLIPIDFEELLTLITEQFVKNEVLTLLEKKRNGSLLAKESPNLILQQFILSEFECFAQKSYFKSIEKRQSDLKRFQQTKNLKLDPLFIEAINEIYSLSL